MSESKTYNKLVRDNIPDIIRSNGDSCEVEILDDKEFLKQLDIKLNEEVSEYQESKSAEEIAENAADNFLKKTKKVLAFSGTLCYYTLAR